MKIKVPFRKGIFLREREIEFIFKIATLEDACEQLKIDFHEMSDVDGYDFGLAVLYNAYLQGCKTRFKKPKYGFHHAVAWNEMMSKESRDKVAECMRELMGSLKKGEKGEKKK